MYSPLVEKLIRIFSKFPTVGPRTAARFVFYLIKAEKEGVQELTETIKELKNKIKICSFCFNPFEGEGELCPICQNPARDQGIVCIVEKEADLKALEKTRKFKGVYFILGNLVSNLKKEVAQKETEERFSKLESRIKQGNIKEIILAINPTTEGQYTILWLQRRLKDFNLKITKLAIGLPVGSELEYSDEETLSSALEGRK